VDSRAPPRPLYVCGVINIHTEAGDEALPGKQSQDAPSVQQHADSSAATDSRSTEAFVPHAQAEISADAARTYGQRRTRSRAQIPASEASAAEESAPTFYSAPEIAKHAPRDVIWIAKPWIAQGAVTVLDGKPKTAGKTTFLAHLLAKVLHGGEFLGEPTTRSPVVLLTEERPVTFRRVLERAGLLEAQGLEVLFRDEVHGQAWTDIARAARDRCDAVGSKLLVVDTLGAFAVGYERSPEAMRAALNPLYDAARTGLAVLAIRHERKSGGTVGESGMGSTVMTAGVDVVLALQRPPKYSGTGRMLYARSRFDETPEATAIELHDGEFVRMQSLEVSAEEVERALFAAAPADPTEAKSADELMFATGLKKTTARTALEHLCGKGKLKRLGSGTKGSPYRYSRPPLEIAA
jgi:RecA-family ATPase